MRTFKKIDSNSLHHLPLFHQIALLSVFPMSVILKIVQFKFLPQKFFFDGIHILNLMNKDELHFTEAHAYDNSALLFKTLNIFGCSSQLEWSVLITSTVSIYMLFLILTIDINSLFDYTKVLFVLGITNIYVFNISKDIIQFVFFFFVALIVNKDNRNFKLSIILIFIVFYLESYLFRSYYILTACFVLILSMILDITLNHKISTKRKIALIIISMFVFLLVFLKLCEYIKPDDYKELMEIRNRLTLNRVGGENSKTLIVNLIDDKGNVFVYSINYIINAVRMMIPIELLTKGFYYYPFVAFQFISTFSLFRCIIRYNILNSSNKLALIVMISYYMVAFLFEPDFGSFVRHEAATIPLFIQLLFYKSSEAKDES